MKETLTALKVPPDAPASLLADSAVPQQLLLRKLLLLSRDTTGSAAMSIYPSLPSDTWRWTRRFAGGTSADGDKDTNNVATAYALRAAPLPGREGPPSEPDRPRPSPWLRPDFDQTRGPQGLGGARGGSGGGGSGVATSPAPRPARHELRVALRLRTLQRHLGSPEQRVWTQDSMAAPLVAQGRGMEPGSSPRTTHVLDTASGLPAQGLRLRLSRLEDHGQQWTELRKRARLEVTGAPSEQRPSEPPLVQLETGHHADGDSGTAAEPESHARYTDPAGRCPGLLLPGQMQAGTYKLSFDTEGYWQKRGRQSFYPYVEVVFTITNETHKFHVPLLLSPWSYTTYQGS
eukprot:XP_028333355.1 uncharacterized protein LOC114484013 [Physeter catodon]